MSYRRLLLPVASSYTVLTPVWNINVSTVSITECNATGKRNRFLFPLLTQFAYVKIALKNIIDNACKYSEKEVDITLSQKDQYLVLEIKDQGIGIPPEEIEHIFQSFYRGSNTHDYAGQGIGLSLTLKIVSAYNARLEISSEIEKGTKVRVIF